MNLSFLKLLCSTAKNANLFLIPVLTHVIHGGELAQEERVGNFLVNFSLVDNSDCQKKKKKITLGQKHMDKLFVQIK